MASEGSNLLFVSFRGRQVPVTFSRAVVSQQHAEMAIASEPFRTWLQRCEQQQHNSGSSSISISSAKTTTVGGYSAKQRLLDVHTIELQSVDMFGPRCVFHFI